MKKKVITILSDSPMLPTGYSDQAKKLAEYFVKQGHEVHYLANAYSGATINKAILEDGTEFNYKIYGELVHSYFMNTIEQHLKQTRSDVLFILLDTFMLMPNLLNKDLSPAKTIFWFPSDGGNGMPNGCDAILRKIDIPVAMAKFGQKQVKDYYGLDVIHIPHGVETDIFYRKSEEERSKLRASQGLNDKFVIGVVARNQPRKMLDRTFKIFAKVKNKIPNAVLYLHMDINDPAQAFDMRKMIVQYNLENKVYFSGMQAHKGIPKKEMINIYNLFDVFLLSTSGEGFGIPIIEAMSCEVPVLATDYTTTEELVKQNEAGLGINLSGVEEKEFFKQDSKEYDLDVANGTILGSWMVDRGICDIDDAVKKLEFLYKNQETRKIMGQNGRKAAELKYDIKNICQSFENLL